MASTINELNWFPGHMAKALKRMEEKLKQCDGVIEIADARAPFSSYSDSLDKLTQNKIKVIVFSKIDLADPIRFAKHQEIYRKKGIAPFAYDLRDSKAGKELKSYLTSLKTSQDRRYEKLGFPLPVKRFMVLGIPNVGKSTFINSLAGKKKAAVENKPGKTRAETLIHVSEKVYIFDAPGILEPNYEDKTVVARLACLGSVKQDILPLVALSDFLLDYLRKNYLTNLEKRYGISFEGNEEEIFRSLALKRQFLLNGAPDSERARNTLLFEFRSGALGRISLDE
ncbi:MAG: ribosome biogenesis GTPase YlqF [Eubacteriales bacterium]|nr:ribosome biogenesis GTPase YlqF [Eubacteriales bacterium]